MHKLMDLQESSGTSSRPKPVTDKPLSPSDTHGMHGYLNDIPAVHASYLAIGAGIRKGNAGTFRNTEVAGRVADWPGIEKPRPSPKN
jgi:hypothetical protein